MRSKCVSKYFYIKIIAIQLYSVSTFYNNMHLKSDLGAYISEIIGDTEIICRIFNFIIYLSCYTLLHYICYVNTRK